MTQDQTNDKILTKVTRIETVLLGVPDTEDGGLVGDVKRIRKDTEKQARELSDHGEAIARIDARCEERTECVPGKRWKTGGKYTAVIGGFSALIYAIVDLIRSA